MPIKKNTPLANFHKPHSCVSGHYCVALSPQGQEVLVADTKNPEQIPLVFDPDEWKSFIASVKQGEFDIP